MAPRASYKVPRVYWLNVEVNDKIYSKQLGVAFNNTQAVGYRDQFYRRYYYEYLDGKAHLYSSPLIDGVYVGEKHYRRELGEKDASET